MAWARPGRAVASVGSSSDFLAKNLAVEYRKAVDALQKQDYKSAAKAAQHVTDAAPQSVDGWRLLAVAQAGAENWKGAKTAYQKAVRLDPNDMTSHAGLGVALAKL